MATSGKGTTAELDSSSHSNVGEVELSSGASTTPTLSSTVKPADSGVKAYLKKRKDAWYHDKAMAALDSLGTPVGEFVTCFQYCKVNDSRAVHGYHSQLNKHEIKHLMKVNHEG